MKRLSFFLRTVVPLAITWWSVPVSSGSAAELLRSQPVKDAADATRRAIVVANDAVKAYRVRSFTNTNNLAMLHRNLWIWKGLVGYGKRDLEVPVYIRPDGADTRHVIQELITMADSRF